jgi:hypothetical protein
MLIVSNIRMPVSAVPQPCNARKLSATSASICWPRIIVKRRAVQSVLPAPSRGPSGWFNKEYLTAGPGGIDVSGQGTRYDKHTNVSGRMASVSHFRYLVEVVRRSCGEAGESKQNARARVKHRWKTKVLAGP